MIHTETMESVVIALTRYNIKVQVRIIALVVMSINTCKLSYINWNKFISITKAWTIC